MLIAGSGLGLLVSQLNNYTLSPISEERVSEAAGVNSAAGSFGLSFGLAFAGAIMLADALLHLHRHGRSQHRAPPAEQEQVADALEDDAEVMSNTQLERAARRPARSDPGRDHPHQHRRQTAALQVALLVPLLAGLLGLFNSFRMMRLPDPTPSGSAEGMALG